MFPVNVFPQYQTDVLLPPEPLKLTLLEPVQKQKSKEEEDEEAELRALQAEMAI